MAGPIGRAPAQRLARDELSRAIYHERSLPQAVEHALLALVEHLFRTASRVTPGGWWTIVALLALVVIAAAAIAARLGPVARSARRTDQSLGRPGSLASTASELRDASAASAAEADYSTAILHRLRAIVASCEERGILAPDAGRTADELAAQAGVLLPGQRAGLAAAAQLFDQIRYGDGDGTLDGYQRLCELDAALAVLRPQRKADRPPATETPATGTPATGIPAAGPGVTA